MENNKEKILQVSQLFLSKEMLGLVMEKLVKPNYKQQGKIYKWELWCRERKWFILSGGTQLFVVNHHLGF